MGAKRAFRYFVASAAIATLGLGPAGAHQNTDVVAQVAGQAAGPLAPAPPQQNTTSFFLSFTAQAAGTYEGTSVTGTYTCTGAGTRSGNLASDFVQGTFSCDATVLVANWPWHLFGGFFGQRTGPAFSISGGIHDGDDDAHSFGCTGTMSPNGSLEATCSIQ